MPKSVQLVDVEVVVSFAMDPTKATVQDAIVFAGEAIAAKLDFLAEQAQWGDTTEPRFYYNSDCADRGRIVS